MEVDALLSEVAALEREQINVDDIPEIFHQFDVVAPSPFALDSLHIVPQSSKNTSNCAYALPPIPSPYANLDDIQNQLDKILSPSFLLQDPCIGGSLLHLPSNHHTSRFLPSVPMTVPSLEWAWKRDQLVTNPLTITSELRKSTKTSSITPTDLIEGLCPMMQKQQQHAKQNIGQQPLKPGGETLAPPLVSSSPVISPSWTTPEVLAQNAIVLATDVNVEEIAPIQAPGLENSLSAEDIQSIQDSIVATESRPDPRNVGLNPSSLLQPYIDMVSNPETLEAIQYSIAKDHTNKEAYGKSTSGNGVVALNELLDELEEDPDLVAMGFTIAEEEEKEVTQQDVTTLPQTVVDTKDPEVEIEQLLTTLSTPSRPLKSKWASLSTVDIRNFHSKVPTLAIQYPFELDTFQKQCILHLEQQDSVFVAAHTSAGKTVIAEYAIALSQQHMTRAIYTSPIKALSNQKYRDFRTTFGSEQVGLITGDVSINPDACCVVMTTEILRSMLYRGSNVIQDVEYVIFDEIHYINDMERGVVWEEVIIMLPSSIQLIFLSATTPNHMEFSEWIGRTKQQKIHVVSTYQRPIPLIHYLYAGNELFPLYDVHNGYQVMSYSAAKRKITPSKTSTRGRTMRSNGGDQSDWTKLIHTLREKTLLPVIVFAFSKRRCEESASKLCKMDLSTPSERSEIHFFITTSLGRLHGSDRELPQVLGLQEMLKRGIGVHHGGLLPILKELVEMLFGKGLIKVLFSTETFAMGVNMPARTVVFNGIRKHDGTTFRDLLPGEYTQMAGRAGRRGLDTVGTVILACWHTDLPEPTTLQTMLLGQATSLTSQFRLTYPMILNLLRVEVLTVEDMMKRSFSEFHTQKALATKQIPQLIQHGQALIKTLQQQVETEYAHLSGDQWSCIQEYIELIQRKRKMEKQLIQLLIGNHSSAAKTALGPGRVVLVQIQGLPKDCIAVILKGNSKEGDTTRGHRQLFESITILCLCPEDYCLPIVESKHKTFKRKDDEQWMGKRIGTNKEESIEIQSNIKDSILGYNYVVMDVPETCIDMITTITLSNRIKHFMSSRQQYGAIVEFLSQASQQVWAFIDVVQELKLNELEIVTAYTEWFQLYQLVQTHFCASSSFVYSRLLIKMEQLYKLKVYCTRLTQELSSDSLSLFPDFQQRVAVLKQLGYLSQDMVVQVKGRVACEINTCDALVLTEIIFENVLASLEPEEIISILSLFICQEKTQNEPHLTSRLGSAYRVVEQITQSLGLIQCQHHVEELQDVEGYCTSRLNQGLMEVVYEWARGTSFKDCCLLTDIQEGSIVRCITRLDEVCREVRNAARVIGDPSLYRKMEVASEAIKRDVVFASSLYLS